MKTPGLTSEARRVRLVEKIAGRASAPVQESLRQAVREKDLSARAEALARSGASAKELEKIAKKLSQLGDRFKLANNVVVATFLLVPSKRLNELKMQGMRHVMKSLGQRDNPMLQMSLNPGSVGVAGGLLGASYLRAIVYGLESRALKKSFVEAAEQLRTDPVLQPVKEAPVRPWGFSSVDLADFGQK